MKVENQDILLSATDVANHLACRHLTSLDLQAARGEIKRIYRDDPALRVLIERGERHEAAYLEHLQQNGLQVLHDARERALDAMKAGVDVIAQAELRNGRWRGRADVLLKVDRPSALGDWSYEVVDTKLARETRGGTILQLCLYSELVAHIQDRMPERMYVVSPGRDFAPQLFRVHDFLAYYRYVKSRLEKIVSDAAPIPTYPEPTDHCDICSWWTLCNDRRRRDDHLAFVAGISKLQINELRKSLITTLAGLAAMPLPEKETAIKIREQARLQLAYRTTRQPVYELLDFETERGLARLPEPTPGDIFLDFEADPFVVSGANASPTGRSHQENAGGMEYLLGYVTLNPETAQPEYSATWAFDRARERHAFESFIDLLIERRRRWPGLHVYHFSQYETTALKRLMGRYATREDELDRLLRAGVFVDLYSITKQSLRAGIERYSLKDLEVFFGFERKTDLRDAGLNRQALECALELNDIASISDEALAVVENYNREDCLSTLRLRDWLEGIRPDGPRPPLEAGDPSEAVDEKRKRVLALMSRLHAGVPDDPAQRTSEQHARWLLGYMLEFHRREEKAPWWEYFRLKTLTDEELFEEQRGISGLQFLQRLEGGTAKCPIDRYRFPSQDIQVRRDDELHTPAEKFGDVEAIDLDKRTIDVKKTGAMAEIHPNAVFAHTRVNAGVLAESLMRLGEWVADHAIDVSGPHQAARDLLLRKSGPKPDNPVLPIQGPPGAGKTYTAARMICDHLRDGKKVGITAVSHKVIRKLLDEVLDAAAKQRLSIQCIEKVKEKSKRPHPLVRETKNNDHVADALASGEATLAAGTAWLWARMEMAGSVDVLFVDEAGQMSLPDVLAICQAGQRIVLLGDPQQLEQPLQGTHPPGVDASALQHILGPHETMPSESGIFLTETWRLSPAICAFTSELFYEGRLQTHAGLELQKLVGPTRFAGSGLWFVPAMHEGNQSSSFEEAEIVRHIVSDLLQSGVAWIDMKGVERALTLNDILIVAPYNAQVFNLSDRLPNARIGTVDKFQGQEAPVVIYSMTTSSPADAPRGMEFLYSLNRFNVATSRARCACILVASARLFEPECQTPRQMKLANALCRYLELSKRETI